MHVSHCAYTHYESSEQCDIALWQTGHPQRGTAFGALDFSAHHRSVHYIWLQYVHYDSHCHHEAEYHEIKSDVLNR